MPPFFVLEHLPSGKVYISTNCWYIIVKLCKPYCVGISVYQQSAHVSLFYILPMHSSAPSILSGIRILLQGLFATYMHALSTLCLALTTRNYLLCVFLIRYLCIVISTAQSKRLDNNPQVVTAWVGKHYEYSPPWSASKATALLMAAWQRAVYRFSKRMQTTWGQKPNTLFNRGCDPTGGGKS